MGKMHFDFRGLHMEVSKGYLELPCGVIPVGLQVYAVCYWLCAGLIVNHIQIVSPKMDWCLDSPLNKSCFPKAWKEFFVLSWLTRHTNISIRMVSKSFLWIYSWKNVLFLTQSHFPLHFFCHHVFLSLFSLIYQIFVFLHRFRLSIFFCMKD